MGMDVTFTVTVAPNPVLQEGYWDLVQKGVDEPRTMEKIKIQLHDNAVYYLSSRMN